MASRERLTLNVEGSEVRLLVAQGQRILRWDSLPLPENVLRGGQVLDSAAFGREVAVAVARLQGPRKQTVVSVSAQRALVRIFHLPPAVPARLLDETVQRTARRELPLPLEDLYLSWQALDEGNGSRLRVLAIGIPREVIDGCMAGLHRAGLRVRAMDFKPLALIRAANLPDVLLADLTAEMGTVALVRGFVPLIVRSVIVSGEATRSPVAQAEQLAVEIQRTLDFYGSTVAAEQPAWSPVVCLSGALGGAEEVRARIGARWPLVAPAPPVPLPGELPLPMYLANIGLVLKREVA